LNPAPNSTVSLPRLSDRRTYRALNPVVRDHSAIWANPHGIEVRSGLHSENLTDGKALEQCRRTAHISARTLTCRHAGAQDLHEHGCGSPAAKHFIPPGALHVFVRRPCH
jgi:hypothetical protein